MDALRRSMGAAGRDAETVASTSTLASAKAVVNATRTLQLVTGAPVVVVDFASQLLGFLTWEGLCLAIVAGLFVTNYVSRAWRRHVRKALATAEMKHSLDCQFTTVETGAMEWINHLLKHLWLGTVGTFADTQANDVLKGILEGLESSKPSFVKDVFLTDFSLGTVPPKIKLYTTRYNPTLDYLQFEFDLDWFADSAHGRLVTKIKLASALPSLKVPIHLTDFGLRGRLLMGMRLTKRLPGVSGVDVSFRGAPKVDVSVRPVGLPIADIPGLYHWIMGKIEEVICKKFLEPRRLFVDVEGKYLSKLTDVDFLGPGGTLVMRIINVRGIPASGKGAGYPWVEVSFNGKRRKTPTRPLVKVVEYGGALAFPLPPETDWTLSTKQEPRDGGGDEDALDVGTVRVRVMDRVPVGSDTVIIGEAVFRAHRRTGTGTHHLSLSMGSHTVESKYGLKSRVAITAQLEWEVLPPIEKWNPLKPAVSESRASAPLKHESDVEASDDDFEDDEHSASASGSDQDSDVDAYGSQQEDDFNDGDGDDDDDVTSGRSGWSEEDRLDRRRRSSHMSSAKSVDHSLDTDGALDSAADHIFQLAKLRGMLHSERVRADGAIARLKDDLRLTQDSLNLERERRVQELKRALLEGVEFYVHSKNSYASLKGDCTYFLRYHGPKKNFSLHRKHGTKAKSVHNFHVSHVAYATIGTKHFTMGVSKAQDVKEKPKAKTERAQRIHGLPASRCLTIIFNTRDQVKDEFDRVVDARNILSEAHEERGLAPPQFASGGAKDPLEFIEPNDLTTTGLVGLDLEVPHDGNGRSAREWVDGINAIRQVYTATEYPELRDPVVVKARRARQAESDAKGEKA